MQVMRERILAGERERDRLLAERDAAREGGGGVKRHVEELREKIASETDAIAKLEAEQAAREAELAKFEEELSALEEQAEAEKEQIIQSMNRLATVRNQQGASGNAAHGAGGAAYLHGHGQPARRGWHALFGRAARRRAGPRAGGKRAQGAL